MVRRMGLMLTVRLTGVLFLMGLSLTACAVRPVNTPASNAAPTPETLPAKSRLAAAGMLKGDMKTRAKVLNDLRITKVASGQMTILFDGYQRPEKSGSTTYSVSVDVTRVGAMVVPLVAVEAFVTGGIILRVSDPGGTMPLPLKYLVEHEFTIGVTEVPAK